MTERDIATIVDAVLASAVGDVVPIVTAGDPVLRTRATEYDFTLPQATFGRLLTVMRATMYDAPGVGLAAPQVGIPLQVAVIEDLYDVDAGVAEVRERTPQPFRVLVNPTYEGIDGSRSFYEGCLSMPGYQAVVRRHAGVRLRCRDESGAEVDERFDGWPARIVQHETDHLAGTLYIDRAEIRSLAENATYARRWADPSPASAADALGFSL
ncbi:peptide deformylase 1 [Rhodococcoides trifolii]|uniref:Peptide deformylase n=1 Tax=Rhodococcoides trifolii TaxID=908250 RepID=A0A917FSY6_9NOCA|nr:peptide deformylase [Rhodococcus trifolii]GGG05562.1 peptide deformylase 1 [Rhodococcus trifolii]